MDLTRHSGRLFGITLFALLACGSDEAETRPAAPSSLLELAGKDAVARVHFASDLERARAVSGVRVDADGALQLLDRGRSALGAPLKLAPESMFGIRVEVARGVSLFGSSDLVVVARRNVEDPTSLAVTVLGAKRLPARLDLQLHLLDESPAETLARKVENLRRRRGYVEAWKRSLSEPSSDAYKFADLVQLIVTTNVERFPDDPARAKNEAIDDMLDVFVAGGHQWEKELLMSQTEAELNPEAPSSVRDDEGIVDPPRHTGFNDVTSKGEGRHRHFASNLGMANKAFGLIPDGLVSFAAKFTGNDFSPEDDPTGDVAADLATNEAGRDFWDFLEQQVQGGTLGDPSAARDWITERFGNTGKACDAPGGCASNACVDGVCCRTACASECVACSAAKTSGPDGTCAPIRAGTDPDSECGDEKRCKDGVVSTGGVCDGAGKCKGTAEKPCANGQCNAAGTGCDCGAFDAVIEAETQLCPDGTHVGSSGPASGPSCEQICCFYGFSGCAYTAAQADFNACDPPSPPPKFSPSDACTNGIYSGQCKCVP